MIDRAALSDLFARARDADIEAVAGTPLFRAGRRLRGECPICGASKGKRSGGAFSVEPEAGLWHCFGSCQRGGDVIDLEKRLRGGSALEAATRLAGMPVDLKPRLGPAVAPRRAEGSKAAPMSAAERIGRDIWAAATRTINETPAARYLQARGLRSEVYGPASRQLRFNPAARWGWDDALGDWITAPAMVARVMGPDGPTGGVHVTYLAPDCSRKARLDPAKRMWGPQRDVDGRPGCVWLSPRDGPGPLIVGEGIESTLSAMQLHGAPCRGLATLSLGALQGGWLTDQWGRIDPAQVAADPERPAFTWAQDPAAPWGEVLIAVDRDMKPVTVKVRKVGGGTAERMLGPEDRARICGGLAVQAWKRAGANAVRVIAPGPGRDFNDELRERLG